MVNPSLPTPQDPSTRWSDPAAPTIPPLDPSSDPRVAFFQTRLAGKSPEELKLLLIQALIDSGQNIPEGSDGTFTSTEISATTSSNTDSHEEPLKDKFTLNEHGFIPGITLSFKKLCAPLVDVLMTDGNLQNNLELRQSLADLIPKFDPETSSRKIRRHLITQLEYSSSASPQTQSRIFLKLTEICEGFTAAPENAINHHSFEGQRGSKKDAVYHNDPTLSDHLNKAIRLVIEISERNGFNNRAVIIRACQAIPEGDFNLSPRAMRRHLIAKIKQASLNLPDYRQKTIADKLQEIRESLPREIPKKSSYVPTRITDLSIPIQEAIDIIGKICEQGGLIHEPTKKELASIIPNANINIDPRGLKRHLIAQLKQLDVTEDPELPTSILSRLQILLTTLEQEPTSTPPLKNVKEHPLTQPILDSIEVIDQINQQGGLFNRQVLGLISQAIPGIVVTTNNRAIKRHIIKSLKLAASLPEGVQEDIAKQLRAILNDIPEDSKKEKNQKSTATQPKLTSEILNQAIEVLTDIDRQNGLVNNQIRSMLCALIPNSNVDTDNRVIARHLKAKLRIAFLSQSESEQKFLLSELQKINLVVPRRITTTKEKAPLLPRPKASVATLVEKPQKEDPLQKTVNAKPPKTAKAKNTVAQKTTPVIKPLPLKRPIAIAIKHIAEDTPLDLALGLNFLGEVAFTSRGLVPSKLPPIPSSITPNFLSSPCPFFPDMRILDTHVLALIPATLNSQALSINEALKLIEPKCHFGYTDNGKLAKKFQFIQEPFLREIVSESYWALIPMCTPKNPNHQDYQVASARELFIVGAIMQVYSNRQIFNGRVATTSSHFQEVDKSEREIVTIGASENQLNVNSINLSALNLPIFSYIGWGLKRIL